VLKYASAQIEVVTLDRGLLTNFDIVARDGPLNPPTSVIVSPLNRLGHFQQEALGALAVPIAINDRRADRVLPAGMGPVPKLPRPEAAFNDRACPALAQPGEQPTGFVRVGVGRVLGLRVGRSHRTSTQGIKTDRCDRRTARRGDRPALAGFVESTHHRNVCHYSEGFGQQGESTGVLHAFGDVTVPVVEKVVQCQPKPLGVRVQQFTAAPLVRPCLGDRLGLALQRDVLAGHWVGSSSPRNRTPRAGPVGAA